MVIFFREETKVTYKIKQHEGEVNPRIMIGLSFLFCLLFQNSIFVKVMDSDIISGNYYSEVDFVLQKNTTINGNLVIQAKKKFDLNGHILTVNGDIAFQNDSSIIY